MPRQFAPAVYNGLKTQWKLLVGLLGGVEATAAGTRGTPSMCSDYGSPNTERFVPVDIVLDAERLAGSPLVTEALARAQGYELLPLAGRTSGPLAVEMARVGEQIGNLFRDWAAAIADQRITEEERERIAADIDAARRVLRDARVALYARESHHAV